MESQHMMFICTTCASVWQGGKRVGVSGGEKLLQQLQELHSHWELHSEFAIQPVECMSACHRSCVISFAANGKFTYLFGDLSPDLSPSEIAGVLECASKYYAHPQGLLPWAERPEPLKKGILAKIPPIPVPMA
ncbi:FeS-binding protein [Nostocales cyanobacterium HT-58-2]|nr:FeS-binding protein [Nostocales cyanobacterium HT-58-2]